MNYPKCSICYNPYTTEGENEPKLLLCGHTFCGKCIQQTKPKQCPNCQKQFKKVTTNFALRDFLPKNNNLTTLDGEQGPPLKKYKSSNMSIEELQQELEQRQRVISIRESLSVVIAAINKNKRNKDIATIDGNITQVEETLEVLKEKRVMLKKTIKRIATERNTF